MLLMEKTRKDFRRWLNDFIKTQVTILVSVKHAQEHRPQQSPNFRDDPGFFEFVPGPEDPLANVLLVLEFKQLRFFFYSSKYTNQKIQILRSPPPLPKKELTEHAKKKKKKMQLSKAAVFFWEGAEVLEWLL